MTSSNSYIDDIQIVKKTKKYPGRYSYVNDDGNEIAVQYSAGAGIGFRVENKNELKAQVRKATFGGISKSGKRMKVVKRPRNKSMSGGSSKKVKVVAKSSRRSGSNNRRKVVRKGQRRVLPAGKKTVSATPLSIVGKSSSMGHKPLGIYWLLENHIFQTCLLFKIHKLSIQTNDFYKLP